MELLPSSALCVLEFEGMLKSAQQTLLIHEKQYWSRLIVTWIQGSILMLGWALLALWVLICCLLFRLEKCFFITFSLMWTISSLYKYTMILHKQQDGKCQVIWSLSCQHLLFLYLSGWEGRWLVGCDAGAITSWTEMVIPVEMPPHKTCLLYLKTIN